MPEGTADNGVALINTRHQNGAGPSGTSSVKSDATTRRRRAVAARRVQRRQMQDIIDLTEDRADDDDVQITRVKTVKRQRSRAADGAAAVLAEQAVLALQTAGGVGMVSFMPVSGLQNLRRTPGAVAAASMVAAPGARAATTQPMPASFLAPGAPALASAAACAPTAPPSPKGFKCTICLERMDGDLATTTCGHMFCYKCITPWVQKSGNCPQCRSKLSKSKVIRIYPPS